MTKKRFVTEAQKGKTVFCLDYVEGDKNASVTGVSGKTDVILAVLVNKLTCVFMKMYKQDKEKTKKNLQIFLQIVSDHVTKYINEAEENPEKLKEW